MAQRQTIRQSLTAEIKKFGKLIRKTRDGDEVDHLREQRKILIEARSLLKH